MAQDNDSPKREANSAEIVFFLFRSSFAFVLGVIFLLLPLAIADTGKPWYFWGGSSLAAFALGAVLFYVGLRNLRVPKACMIAGGSRKLNACQPPGWRFKSDAGRGVDGPWCSS